MHGPSWMRAAKADVGDAAPVEYLYVPCAGVGGHGHPARTSRWVQRVPVVKKTAKWIYYASDSWNRSEAVVGPGRISREQFEAGRHGYPAGVIPIPGDRRRAGQPGRLFFASRQAAEAHLHRGERARTVHAAPRAGLVKELRRAMADAHPDRGGTVEQFIQARSRYQTALRYAGAQGLRPACP